MDENQIKLLKTSRRMLVNERSTTSMTLRLPVFCRSSIAERDQQSRLKNLAFLVWLTNENFCPREHEGSWDDIKQMMEYINEIASSFQESWKDGSLVDVYDYTQQQEDR